MKVLILNLLLLSLSSLWMGCDCDQPGGKMEGKQCKSGDAASEPGVVSGGNTGEPTSIGDLEGKSIRTPTEIAWNAVDGAAYYQVRLHERGGDCSVESSIFEQRADSNSMTFDPGVADGDYLLCVVAYDANGNILDIQQANITIDNTAPSGYSATWEFSDQIGHADIKIVLPADVSDFQLVSVSGSDILGPMPACGEAIKEEFDTFAGGTSLNHHVDVTQDGNTDNAGYVMNYRICAYDAAGNGSSIELPYVRTTLTIHNFFFTSDTFDGDFGTELSEAPYNNSDGYTGLDAADALCIAAKGGVDQNWKAVLSDNSTAVTDHISMRGPVRNANSEVFARSLEQLLSQNISTDLAFDENGAVVAGRVWSGTYPDGTRTQGLNCLNWGSSSAGQFGSYGDISANTFVANGLTTHAACDITKAKHIACASQYDVKRITLNNSPAFSGLNISFDVDYPAGARVELRRAPGALGVDGSCVNPSDTIVEELPMTVSSGNHVFNDTVPSAGRYSYRICVFDKYGGPAVSSKALGSKAAESTQFNEIFVSALSYKGNIDGSSPNAACAASAVRAGLDGTWVALISTAGQDASAILNGDSSPMMDLGSAVIAADTSALFANKPAAPISLSEYGYAVSGEVWTGASSAAGGQDGNLCGGWTNATSGATSYQGIVGATNGSWMHDAASYLVTCNNDKRLYCVRK